MILMFDTGVLGQLCHPHKAQNQPIGRWLSGLLNDGSSSLRVFVPEIADYELRRKLLHLLAKNQTPRESLERLNKLGRELDYLPLDTATLRQAAELWAEARICGT